MSHTKNTGVLGDVDLVTTDGLRALAGVAGPCVSLFLPTGPREVATTVVTARLARLADRAVAELDRQGFGGPRAGEVLEPVRGLVDDEEFWQHRSESLAAFAAPGSFTTFRMAVPLPEEVAVGGAFRISPLVPLLTEDTSVVILALAQNAVRLYRATRRTIEELPLGDIPTSMRTAIPEDQHEQHGQSHSTGGGIEQFHGQGGRDDFDKAALERWFRAVDRPLTERLGPRGDVLVLACVAHYLPIYRAVSRYPRIWPHPVAGNPEHRSIRELHAAALDVMDGHVTGLEERQLDRFRQAAGTGRTADRPDQVLGAAREGRVDALLLDAERTTGAVDEVAEAAIVETLRHGGLVVPVSGAPEIGPVAALLRS